MCRFIQRCMQLAESCASELWEPAGWIAPRLLPFSLGQPLESSVSSVPPDPGAARRESRPM